MELDTFQQRWTDKCRDRLKIMANLPNTSAIDYTEESRAARLHPGLQARLHDTSEGNGLRN